MSKQRTARPRKRSSDEERGHEKVLSSSRQQMENHYEIGDLLGAGAFGTVHRCVNKDTGDVFAMKTIDKRSTTQEYLNSVQNESRIMMSAEHPNIIKFKEIFETRRSIHIVMELCEGGELMDVIVERGVFSEKDASVIVGRLLHSLSYLHKRGIVHRDLKPENILLHKAGAYDSIKITDFGLSVVLDETHVVETVCGTPHYVAPEVLKNEGYGESADLWSTGVITYLLVTGQFPFKHENMSVLYEQIMEGRFEYPPGSNVSPLAKDLINRLLTVDVLNRIHASEAMDHPWIKGDVASAAPVGSILDMLRAVNAENRFRKAAHAIVATERLMKSVNFHRLAAGGPDALLESDDEEDY